MNALRTTVEKARVTLAVLSGLLVIALIEVARGGMPPPPLPCSASPQDAAIAFFEFIETPGSERAVADRAAQIFSAVLLRSESPHGVLRFVESTKRTYGIDKFDRPLSQRLAGPPQVSSGSGAMSVRILALSPRGTIELRALLRCEDGVWKVGGFSYGPP